MDRAELSALGLPVTRPAAGDLAVGPYTVFLKDGRASRVHVRLADLPGLRVGGEVFTAGGGVALEAIARRLPGCTPLRHRLGGNAILCDGGRTELLDGAGNLAFEVNAPEQAEEEMKRDRQSHGGEQAGTAASASPGAEALWKHPGMNLSFRYPSSWLGVQQKPDGARLQSEVLAEVEDRSTDTGPPTLPTPFVIHISVSRGKLLEVMKRTWGNVNDHFPTGREESFKEEGIFAERTTVGGKPGYSFIAADHDQHTNFVFAEVAPGWTVEVECRYVSDMWKPKVLGTAQAAACGRVIDTLAFKP
jgi:hypothetical protein